MGHTDKVQGLKQQRQIYQMNTGSSRHIVKHEPCARWRHTNILPKSYIVNNVMHDSCARFGRGFNAYFIHSAP